MMLRLGGSISQNFNAALSSSLRRSVVRSGNSKCLERCCNRLEGNYVGAKCTLAPSTKATRQRGCKAINSCPIRGAGPSKGLPRGH